MVERYAPETDHAYAMAFNNSFRKHNMDAALSHMQTHEQIKEGAAKGDRVHAALLTELLTDWLPVAMRDRL